MAKSKGKTTFIDRLGGDKVVWTIMLFLCMISLVSLFSATSQLASESNTRLDIVKDQVITIAMGLFFVFLCYRVNSIKLFKALARWGFALSLALLAFVDLHIRLPLISAASINDAWRVIKIFGFQVHVLEVVKVAMVMYLAWAIDRLQNGEFKLLDKLSNINRLEFLGNKLWQEIICVILPSLIIVVASLPASNSSALFLAGIMFLTMLLGRINFFHIVATGLFCGLMLAGCFGLYKLSSGLQHNDPDAKVLFRRIGTGVSRVLDKSIDYEEIIRTADKGSKEYQTALDRIRQPYGAKIAIKEGGMFGKGPGNSTQKYKVPVIYEDYIFSFIIEEYGLLFGGLFIFILYLSLLARGSIIARNCNDHFAKCAVAGLCMLITAQAMMHITVNCDIGFLTGQTLPLVSYGTTAFVCFSIAFGIILSISRMAEKNVEKERLEAAPLIELQEDTQDELRNSLNDLDQLDSMDI